MSSYVVDSKLSDQKSLRHHELEWADEESSFEEHMIKEKNFSNLTCLLSLPSNHMGRSLLAFYVLALFLPRTSFNQSEEVSFLSFKLESKRYSSHQNLLLYA